MHKKLSLCLLLASSFAHAAEGENLDDLLQGFDEPVATQPAANDGDASLDAVLEGFAEEPASANGDSALDAVLGGFDDQAPATVNETTSKPASPFNSSLTLRASTTYNIDHDAPAAGKTDYRGLSRARLQLSPEIRWKMDNGWRGLASASFFYDASYEINGRSQYTDQVLDENESEAELRELYIQGSLTPNLDLKLGRQIVAWGKSDSLRVVDVLNPLDRRETGMVDIEDLRLPLTMAKADYYFGDWQLSGILIPEIRFNKNAPYGSDFYPSPSAPSPEVIPSSSLDNMEYAMALSGRFHGWDLSLHAAHIINDSFHIDAGPPKTLQHSELDMLGMAFTAVSGSFLYKAEMAHFDGLKFQHGGDNEFSRLDVMLGVDYSGIKNTTLTLEVIDQYLLNYQAALKQQPDDTEEHEGAIAFRYTQTFMHERLELTFLLALSGDMGEGGGFYRPQASYDLSDNINITGGGIFYEGGDSSFFNALEDNDRLFLELKYEL